MILATIALLAAFQQASGTDFGLHAIQGGKVETQQHPLSPKRENPSRQIVWAPPVGERV